MCCFHLAFDYLLIQIAVVFHSNCHLPNFGTESVGLFLLALMPLIIYPLYWWLSCIDSWTWEKFSQWSVIVVAILCVAGQIVIVIHSCIIWSNHSHFCDASSGVTEILYVLFICWLVFYMILALIGMYLMCKFADDNEDRISYFLVGYLGIVIFVLPICAAGMQLATLQSSYGCHGDDLISWTEAVALLVLVLSSTGGWAFTLPATAAEFSTTATCVGFCNLLSHLAQFGLACHSLSFFANYRSQCYNHVFASCSYGLFLTWVTLDGLMYVVTLVGCCFTLVRHVHFEF